MAREKAPLPNAAPADDKKRAIDTAMAQIERMYGKGAIMRFGDKAELNVDYIPTGSLSLDLALGIGGMPRGRIIEIYGPESSGKTPWPYIWWPRCRSAAHRLYFSEQRTTKAAPSCIRQALAAVITFPPGNMYGRRSNNRWLIEGLIPSSFLLPSMESCISDKIPSFAACAALLWLNSTHGSISALVTFSVRAVFSAPSSITCSP